MAIRDHTARTRLSVPPDSSLTTSPGRPPPAGTQGTPRHLSFPLDPALASYVLTRLRIDMERHREAKASGRPIRPVEWPLSGEVIACLTTAIHCLDHYAGLLGHELAVNDSPVR
jgi:hypothetical protein